MRCEDKYKTRKRNSNPNELFPHTMSKTQLNPLGGSTIAVNSGLGLCLRLGRRPLQRLDRIL
jgi:hypothetical protein